MLRSHDVHAHTFTGSHGRPLLYMLRMSVKTFALRASCLRAGASVCETPEISEKDGSLGSCALAAINRQSGGVFGCFVFVFSPWRMLFKLKRGRPGGGGGVGGDFSNHTTTVTKVLSTTVKQILQSSPADCVLLPPFFYNPPPTQKCHIVEILFSFYVLTFELSGPLYPVPNARDDDRRWRYRGGLTWSWVQE